MRRSSERLLVFLVCVAALAAFRCAPAHPAIVVDYGSSPADFEGADFELDGKIVGKLKRDGQKPRTSFPVDAGDHAVRVAAQKYDSQPDVQTVKAGEELILFVEIKTAARQGGRPVAALHR